MEVDNMNQQNYVFAQPGVAVSPQPVAPNAFGMLVPGGPVRHDFAPVDGSGTKFALQMSSPGDFPNPLLVNELVFFLGAPMAPSQGVMVYWQLTSGNEQSGFELLGSITMDQPSQIFRTGWSEHDQFLSLPPHQPVTVTIGLSIEPLESIRNVASTTSANANARRPLVAQKIAQDLYNFMQSFDSGVGGNSGTMTVPTNIFERWWKRFESKSQRDPSFFLKNSV
jgi:hypothetical protein